MIEHLGSVISDDVISWMRRWISDCPWPNLTPEDVDDLTDREVVRGVARYYEGGVERFLAHSQAAS